MTSIYQPCTNNAESDAVVIDIPEGQQELNRTVSSYNEENVEAVVALAVKLLDYQLAKKSPATQFGLSPCCLYFRRMPFCWRPFIYTYY